MFNRKNQIAFCILFMLMITMPMVFTNIKDGTVSEAEKRVLEKKPSFFDGEGKINKEYTSDLEKWINDNVGFRNLMVILNARIQYHGFRVLSNNSDMYLGPKGEFNYATKSMLEDYQHFNLYPDKYNKWNAKSLQTISDHVEGSGAQFYYFQCWDKHSVYPEYFPRSVLQYGEYSKTDHLIETIKNKTSVNVISVKDTLIDSKNDHQVYSKWGDPTHWTQRGAYIAYKELMNVLNSNNDNRFRVLEEDAYDIILTDQGSNIFGDIHKVDMLENFVLIEQQADLSNNKLTLYSDDQRHKYYVNENADNDTRILIIGDSYFDGYIIDDIAESFSETIMLWNEYTRYISDIIEAYQPDIVILEAAERVDISNEIIAGAEIIDNKS